MMYFVVPTRPEGDLDLGNRINITSKLARDCLRYYYSDADSAAAAATDLAIKNPTVQFAVMGPLGIYETVIPKVIRKKLTENGEIVVDEEQRA